MSAGPTATATSLGARVAGEFPILERREGDHALTYLDSAATAQKPRRVIDAISSFYEHSNANIHRSVYPLAAEATEAFEGARADVARFIGAGSTKEVVFTRNATEAINLVANSWGRANLEPGDTVVLTQMEHHSNIVPWQLVTAERGARLEYVTVGPDGALDLDQLDALLARRPKLVAFAHVSNVLGTINPVAEVVARAHAAGALVVVDGAQAAPHLPLDVAALGADFYAFTGHKLYGPTGIGVLYGRRELLEAMPPFLGGGDMIRSVDWHESKWNDLPWKFEAGTSPIAPAVGLGAAVRWLEDVGIETAREHEAALVDEAVRRLEAVPGLRVFGPPAGVERGAVASFAIVGVHPHDVAELLGREGVCIRAGHHCAQPLMRTLGVAATSRASFGVHNTSADIDRLIDGLGTVRRIFELD
jgi:cysteine desulfurase / selenocysteine lyase